MKIESQKSIAYKRFPSHQNWTADDLKGEEFIIFELIEGKY